TTRRPGRQAVSRRPISSKALLSWSRCASGILSQSRAMIGPWLAANTPTRLAMGDTLLGAFPAAIPAIERMQPRDELCLRHAADLEIEAQQIGVDQRRDGADVVGEQRLADLRLDLIAVDHAGHIAAVLRRQLGIVLQFEEQLADPIVRHYPLLWRRPAFNRAPARSYPPGRRLRSADRSRPRPNWSRASRTGRGGRPMAWPRPACE